MATTIARERRQEATASGGRHLVAGFALVVVAGTLAVSAWMPWFRSSVGTSGTHDINGFRSGSWIFGVPIGFTLLGVAAVFGAMGLAFIAPTRVRWPAPARWVPPLVGALTLAWILADRAYVHREVRADLQRAIDQFVQTRPDAAAQGQALLASSRLTDGNGLRLAVVVALATTVVGAWLVRRKRAAAAAAAATSAGSEA